MQRQDYLYDSEIFKRIFEQYYKLLCYFAEKKVVEVLKRQ